MDRKNLRVVDLVSKLTRSNLRDTVRILQAFEAVADYLEESTDDILAGDIGDVPPTQDNSRACNDAYHGFVEWIEELGDSEWLERLRNGK